MRYIVLLILVSGLTACSEHPEMLHWSYSGEGGPEHWAALDSDFQLCSEGTAQSPVDLSGFEDVDLDTLALSYQDCGHEVIYNGHTVQVNYESGSNLVVNNRQFELKQFHFHTPSENRIEGKAFPLEMHLVHANDEGALAVLAVLFESGISNTVLESIWTEMPRAVGETIELSSPVDAQDLLPDSLEYFRFDGSLTTPPCSEGVLWFVLAQRVSVSDEQVDSFLSLIGHSNNRPIQSLNGRSILK
ncbi:MAG: carbonic anhydrase family protein [Bacteroidetes bacterium]|nr:carbonic anhydrase family protein [Bacteroidota bacterium]